MRMSYLLISLIFFTLSYSLASGPDIPRTQLNNKTSYFEDILPDPEGMNREYEQMAANASDMARNADQQIEVITGSNADQARREASTLSSLKVRELKDRGQQKMVEEDLNVHVDFSKSLNQRHMRDANQFAKGQNKLLGSLMSRLEEAGLDCQIREGAKTREQAYYLQMEQKSVRDSKYNQAFCEELSNKYNCTDVLHLRCAAKSMRWRIKERRVFNINGHELFNLSMARGSRGELGHFVLREKVKKYLFGLIRREKSWHEWHIHTNPRLWRGFLAERMQVPIDRIGEDVSFPHGGSGQGGLHAIPGRGELVCGRYVVSYEYKEGDEICDRWNERWEERCTLQ